MRALLGRLSVLVVLPWVLVGCALFGFGSAESNASTTCLDWRAMGSDARLRLAERLVGGSAEVLERVRAAQHEAAATSRETLVREVEGTLTKNCDVMRAAAPPLAELFRDLYLVP